MNIFLDYKYIEGPWGGINSFFKSFSNEVEGGKHEVTLVSSPSKADVILLGAAYRGPGMEIDGKYVQDLLKKRYSLANRLMRKNQYKVFHRLDGLRSSYTGRSIPNDQKQIDIAKCVDNIVFQSLESEKVFCSAAPELRRKTSKIIYNGANQNVFHFKTRNLPLGRKIKLFAVSWSTDINKGFRVLSELSMNPNFDVAFAGQWNSNVPLNDVRFLGALEHERLAEALQSSDVFVHAAKNDPCPNVVLEALSSGLPVLFHPSGGTLELAKDYGFSLGDFPDFDLLSEKIRSSYSHLTSKIENDLQKFSITSTVDDYVDFFKECL